jgi:hypothetical protein
VVERATGAADDPCQLLPHPPQRRDPIVDLVDLRGPEPVTFLHVVRLRGIDASGFAEIDKTIGPEPPQGLVFHVNGPLDDGWATVGFWTSKAARDRFIQERIAPAMAGSGEQPAIEDLELHNSLTEAAAGTTA